MTLVNPMQFFSRRFVVVSLVAFIFLGSVHAQTLQRVEQADFGKTRDGSEVKLVTLRNSNGMSAQIITYGAIIKELMAPDQSDRRRAVCTRWHDLQTGGE